MSDTRRVVLFFALLCVLYHANLRPVASGDSLPASLIPLAILFDGSVNLDRFGPWNGKNVWYGRTVVRESGGHWYSFYPIAGPALATPLYVPFAVVPWFRQQPPGVLISIARIAEKFVAVLLAAAAAVAMLLLLQRLTPGRTAWILAFVFALGTGNWSTSSQALWQHTFGALPIIVCLCAITYWKGTGTPDRWYWIAGICAGLALAIRPTNLGLLPGLAAALWTSGARGSSYVRVFSPITAAAAATAAYNLYAFHSLTGGYPAQLAGDWAAGLAGILVSPGRGLVLYTPVALFAVCAFLPAAKEARRIHCPVLVASSTFMLFDLALVAKWPGWWGGYCWGPRLVTEILAPLMVLIAIGSATFANRELRWAFGIAAVYGCFIQSVGVFCYPKGHWDSTPISVNESPARLWSWSDNPIDRTLQGGIAWEPYAVAFAAVSGGPPAASRKLRELGINPY